MLRRRLMMLSLLSLSLGSTSWAQRGTDLQDEEGKKQLAEPEDDRRAKKGGDDSEDSGNGSVTTLDKDRVRSIQQKPYLKRHRFSLTGLGNISLNDPFYSKVGGSVALAFYLQETLAIGVRGSLVHALAEDDVRTAKSNFQNVIVSSTPSWAAMAEVEWSPLYGKVRFYNSILHLDGYLFTGFGAVSARTPEPAFELGIGMRLVATDWLAFNLAFSNTTYSSAPLGSTLSLTQNLMTLNAGLSLFIPFSSSGGGAE
jgi:outer membrane beta-barrel protein